jgi:hypothetical protein
MTFEISLRPPFSLPRVLRAQKDDSRQHWVGDAPPTSQNMSNQGSRGNKPLRERNDQGYRPLATIKLGEIEDAQRLFEYQLISAGENWIGKNCFCTIPLKRIRDGRPPEIFGRVKTCFPSDGHIENIEELEILFPHTIGEPPDIVHVYKEDISQYSQKLAQSYYVRVQFKASEEDAADFAEAASMFSSNGFYPEFDSGYYDLLEMDELNQSRHPWLYIIGSRWFDIIPDSIHTEIKVKFKEMLHWGKHIFNYHPEWLSNEVNTLNRVLGFKYGFTKQVLIEPGNIEETGIIIARTFDRIMSIPVS